MNDFVCILLRFPGVLWMPSFLCDLGAINDTNKLRAPTTSQLHHVRLVGNTGLTFILSSYTIHMTFIDFLNGDG